MIDNFEGKGRQQVFLDHIFQICRLKRDFKISHCLYCLYWHDCDKDFCITKSVALERAFSKDKGCIWQKEMKILQTISYVQSLHRKTFFGWIHSLLSCSFRLFRSIPSAWLNSSLELYLKNCASCQLKFRFSLSVLNHINPAIPSHALGALNLSFLSCKACCSNCICNGSVHSIIHITCCINKVCFKSKM